MRKIFHVGVKSGGTVRYRRVRLSEWLKNKFSNYFLMELFDILTVAKNDIILLSRPVIAERFLKLLKSNGNIILYERTDNWQAIPGKKSETINDVITCKLADEINTSSKWLYDNSLQYNDKVNFIPNGCTIHNYDTFNVEKYHKKTAVFIGNHYDKIDVDLLEKLAYENKDWNIDLYSRERANIGASNIRQMGYVADENELYKILRKSHLGLIPFKQGDWTLGMRPLKLLQYIDARLPSIYCNCPEAEYFSDACKRIESLSLDSYISEKYDFDKYIPDIDWNDIFEQIAGVISKYAD